MKVSEIKVKDIAEYLRMDDVTNDDEKMIESMIRAAIAYIVDYTSQSEEDLDLYEDIYIVVYILCQDMYDNRAMYIDGNERNRTVDTILNFHRKTLIG